ncbi:hypothetical protein GCM10009847_23690 [Leucobacter tardus]|uniref:NAD-dependent epimerase/dehydratase family protein n=2 Tax=Leucobacter tardus TaxID=501483 RepID=A0A939TN39_9MICO|nr:NAD-dependent epimerase/dehydratase family protein [Leucobacter tardus]
MRVVVVGATGNIGTAVLRALHETDEVTSVVGVARRRPDSGVVPYADVAWHSIDIAAASTELDARAALESVFTGADAVIHLAWLIQPNTDRSLLRRVNVAGTERVARAAAAAGVPRLLVSSSVGAYSADPEGAFRDEQWPTDGIRTSHYSADKVAQERVLDAVETAHPDMRIVRMRPALVFQGTAASGIQRLFLGPWAGALRAGKPPVLPLPSDFRSVQAVHADDVGRAFAAAATRDVAGAFNLAADDVLGREELAKILDHGRVATLPTAWVRSAMTVAYRLRILAADPGWLDLGLSAPLMDTRRARAELDWAPRVTAAAALSELVDAIRSGEGGDSAPLMPRRPQQRHLPGSNGMFTSSDRTRDAGDTAPGERSARDQLAASMIDAGLLGLYLSDHLTGATAGAERAERMSADAIDTPVYARLSEAAREIRLERAFVKRLISELGVPRRRHRQFAGWFAEHLGRLKANGAVVRRSPLTLVLESEIMRSAVLAKLGMWRVLQEHAPHLGWDPEVFVDLAGRAEAQADMYSEVHEYARRRAFRSDRDVFPE